MREINYKNLDENISLFEKRRYDLLKVVTLVEGKKVVIAYCSEFHPAKELIDYLNFYRNEKGENYHIEDKYGRNILFQN